MRGGVAKKSNRYYPYVYAGRGEEGKKKYTYFGGYSTKKEAQRVLAEKVVQMNNGIPEPSKDTLKSYLLQWLEDKRTQIRPGTLRSYAWIVNKHIIPNIGHLPLADIKPQHIQALYRKLQSPPINLSSQSVLNAHRILVQALNLAVNWDLLQKNAAKVVRPPRPDSEEMRVWNKEELTEFLRSTEQSRYHIAYVILSATGMRLGEALGLKWSDIDFQRSKIKVQRALAYTGKGYEIQRPKTKSGVRNIDVPPNVLKQLLVHKEKQAVEQSKAQELWEANDWVVASVLGRPIQQHNIRMQFHKSVQRAGLPRIRMHDLRHTHATLLLEKGVHPKSVQERLGHSDVSLTLNTYSHVSPSLQEAAAMLINDLFQ